MSNLTYVNEEEGIGSVGGVRGVGSINSLSPHTPHTPPSPSSPSSPLYSISASGAKQHIRKIMQRWFQINI
ncbi:hypothetical protein H1Q63_15625 [Desmonostoc muscorum CCALA 125]|nr:hypothetical protein [Desmonostoc muscorum CCALA 125]